MKCKYLKKSDGVLHVDAIRKTLKGSGESLKPRQVLDAMHVVCEVGGNKCPKEGTKRGPKEGGPKEGTRREGSVGRPSPLCSYVQKLLKM